MALDTKYRPHGYDDVLGQSAAKAVLRQFVKEKKGFHQSYVFCGQHGSGKTTMGRILARALLCENPDGGNPCDKCHSCTVLLTDGAVHESFEELDAASKSGVKDLERIVEDVQYGTFSGKRRIYLFDESHQLSKKALDILLKPMEDNIEGEENKKLVCIFCTTEPDKMRSTIFSRCAPAFVIQAVDPEKIAERLAWVCEQEGYEHDLDALVAIADVAECHIRDALKTVEGVSMLGKIDKENTFRYLQLGANDLALDILEAVGAALPKAVAAATRMAMEVSPSSAYERLAEASMCAYRAHLGVGKIPLQWDAARLTALSARGESLLGIASRFASPPHRPSRHTLVLDVGTAHYALVSSIPPSQVASLVLEVKSAPSAVEVPPEVSTTGSIPEPKPQAAGTVPTGSIGAPAPEAQVSALAAVATPVTREPARIEGGVWIDTRGIGPGPAKLAEGDTSQSSSGQSEMAESTLSSSIFREMVHYHLKEMTRGRTGQQG